MTSRPSTYRVFALPLCLEYFAIALFLYTPYIDYRRNIYSPYAETRDQGLNYA
jgi:hypothetical protein